MIINEEIEILKNFKYKNPWCGNYTEKMKKFKNLLNDFSYIRKIDSPKLIIPRNLNENKWQKKESGQCSYDKKRIRLKNFSVISFLHEFKHWVDLNEIYQKDNKKKWNEIDYFFTESEIEWNAEYYSIKMFYIVWPEKLKYLNEILKIKSLKEYNFVNNNYKFNPHCKAIIDIIKGN